jgi:hypothetical protein
LKCYSLKKYLHRERRKVSKRKRGRKTRKEEEKAMSKKA